MTCWNTAEQWSWSVWINAAVRASKSSGPSSSSRLQQVKAKMCSFFLFFPASLKLLCWAAVRNNAAKPSNDVFRENSSSPSGELHIQLKRAEWQIGITEIIDKRKFIKNLHITQSCTYYTGFILYSLWLQSDFRRTNKCTMASLWLPLLVPALQK